MITHRRTEILTYNPNFDFGAVYTNTLLAGLVQLFCRAGFGVVPPHFPLNSYQLFNRRLRFLG